MKINKFVSVISLSVLSAGLLFGAVNISYSNNHQEVLTTEAWNADVKPSVQPEYYSSCEGKTGIALKSALATFNKPKTPSYDWSRYEAADEAQDDSTSIFCLYTRHNIKKNKHVGSYSWDTWNREHVFTQSAFPKSATDNHNIFACEGLINNERGNKPFAELKDKGGSRVSVHGHVTDCYQTSSLFEPCDEAKGEVARACLYVSVYHGYNLSSIFDSVDTCLKWNATYTVTPREIYRNNIVQGLQGNRNPFIDHPSYAKLIYGGPDYSGVDPLSPIDPVDVTGVSLDNTSATIEEKQTLQLTATISPSDATNKKVTWSSENTAIATVSNTGLVTAVKEGNTTITVTTDDGGYQASCNLTVSKATPVLTSISLDTTNVKKNYKVNETFDYTGLVVTANYSVGDSKIVTPSSVSSPNMTTSGTKTITVTYIENNVTKSNTFTITVNAILTSITLSKNNDEYYQGAPLVEPTITAHYTGASDKDVSNLVSKTGNYDMDEIGEYSIVYTYIENEIETEATYNFSVVESEYKKIPDHLEVINIKQSYLLNESFETPTVYVHYTDEEHFPKEDKTSSSNFNGFYSNVVHVGTITVRYESLSFEYQYSVSEEPPAVTGVTLDRDSLELKVGDQSRLKATLSPSGIEDNLQWSSSDTEIAKVSSSGLITAIKEGTATITVTTSNGLTASCEVVVKSNQKPASSGCSGSVASTSVILSSLSILTLGLLLIKRKKIH